MFPYKINLLIFLNIYEFFQNFLTFLKFLFSKCFQDYGYVIVLSIPRNFLKWNVKFGYIRNSWLLIQLKTNKKVVKCKETLKKFM